MECSPLSAYLTIKPRAQEKPCDNYRTRQCCNRANAGRPNANGKRRLLSRYADPISGLHAPKSYFWNDRLPFTMPGFADERSFTLYLPRRQGELKHGALGYVRRSPYTSTV